MYESSFLSTGGDDDLRAKPPMHVLLMPLRASPDNGIREMCKRVGLNMLQLLEDDNAILNHDGYFVREIYESQKELSKAGFAIVYYKQNKQTFGSSTNMKNCAEFHALNDGDNPRILTLINLDSAVSPEIDELLKGRLFRHLERILASANIPPGQKKIFEAILRDGGWKLVLQLVEIGLQTKYDEPRMMEAFAFDQATIDNQQSIVDRAVERLCQKIPNFGRFKKVLAVASWKVGGPERLFTRIVVTETLSDFWIDPLPFPAIRDAQTDEELYSTAYEESEKRQAKQIVKDQIKEMKDPSLKMMLFLDDNKSVLFTEAGELHAYLRKEQFQLIDIIFEGEIRMYVHEELGGVVLVHAPLGLAGDARRNISMEWRKIRSMTVAILQGVYRRVKGYVEPPKYNILHASAAFEIICRGMHNYEMQGSVFFKHLLTSKNAFEDCKLGGAGRADDSSLFLSGRDRRERKSERTNESQVINKAINILSRFKFEPNVENPFMETPLSALLDNSNTIESIHEIFLPPKMRNWNRMTKLNLAHYPN